MIELSEGQQVRLKLSDGAWFEGVVKDVRRGDNCELESVTREAILEGGAVSYDEVEEWMLFSDGNGAHCLGQPELEYIRCIDVLTTSKPKQETG